MIPYLFMQMNSKSKFRAKLTSKIPIWKNKWSGQSAPRRRDEKYKINAAYSKYCCLSLAAYKCRIQMTKDNEQKFKKVAMSEYGMKYASGVAAAAADGIISSRVDLAIAVGELIWLIKGVIPLINTNSHQPCQNKLNVSC